jgi:hypothetical protein
VVGRRIVRGHGAPVLRYRPEMRRACRRPFRTSLLSVASLAALTVGLTSCFTTTADFRNDAETFIEENDELRDVLFPGSDTAFETATCVEPRNQDEGTTFPCTAIDTEGATWEFEIVITGSTEYDVNVARRPSGS